MIWGLLGGVVVAGVLSAWWLERRITLERRLLGMPETIRPWTIFRPVLVSIVIVSFAAAVGVAEGVNHTVDVPEVQPSEQGRLIRTGYHIVLVTLLVLGTAIDLDCYILPDSITLTGLAVGLLGAVTFQELQIAHLWVDWAYARPQIQGPYIPGWYDQQKVLHALAWSLAGAITGAGVTQLVRVLSRALLGQEAMGLGDVTFMAMIGSFLGWQAVLVIFAVAPLTGLGFAIMGKMVANRPYLPYGPCLAAATVIVLLGWSEIWQQTRLFFSDLLGVAMVAGGAMLALAVMLFGLRTYRRIPTGVTP